MLPSSLPIRIPGWCRVREEPGQRRSQAAGVRGVDEYRDRQRARAQPVAGVGAGEERAGLATRPGDRGDDGLGEGDESGERLGAHRASLGGRVTRVQRAQRQVHRVGARDHRHRQDASARIEQLLPGEGGGSVRALGSAAMRTRARVPRGSRGSEIGVIVGPPA